MSNIEKRGEAKKVLLKDLSIGDKAEISKVMNLDLIKAFAFLSNDYNPLHLDAKYASKSRYKKQIIPGMMVSFFLVDYLDQYYLGKVAFINRKI